MKAIQKRDLNVIIGDDARRIAVTREMQEDAVTILEGIDRDLDNGWQLGRHFIDSPDIIQRCQIAGDRLLTALHTNNQASVSLMAAYILSRLPEVHTAVLNTEGEAEETLFYDHDSALLS